MGRTVSAIITLLGINYASLLTAALSNAMGWSSSERSALNLCLREQARTTMKVMAATVIQLWFRRKKSPVGLDSKQMQRLLMAKKQFYTAHTLSLLGIEDCADANSKVLIPRLSRLNRIHAAQSSGLPPLARSETRCPDVDRLV